MNSGVCTASLLSICFGVCLLYLSCCLWVFSSDLVRKNWVLVYLCLSWWFASWLIECSYVVANKGQLTTQIINLWIIKSSRLFIYAPGNGCCLLIKEGHLDFFLWVAKCNTPSAYSFYTCSPDYFCSFTVKNWNSWREHQEAMLEACLCASCCCDLKEFASSHWMEKRRTMVRDD